MVDYHPAMNIRAFVLILVPWLLMARPASAQPADDDDDDRYDEAVPGEAVASVDVFYDRLSDDGYWVDEPDIGHVFIPDQPNFVPYHDGHWSRTSLGFVWVSNEPFAWATTHYGRWAYSQPYARWVWLPDTTWGPSWVEWRESGDDFGWAPLAPDVVVQAGYSPPIESWHYCAGARLLDVNVGRYYEPRDRVVVIHRSGAPLEHYARVGGARVVVGPPAVRLRAHNIAVTRPTRIEPRLVGRMTVTESRAAVQRAHDRHDAVEVQNRRRIESNTTIRETQRRVVVPTRQPGADTRRVQEPKYTPRTPEPRPDPRYNTAPRHEPRRVEPVRQTPPTPRTEPKAQPRPNAARTMKTIGARHS